MRLTPPPATTPSFEKSAIPLLLIIKPSRFLLSAMAAIHALAISAIITAATPIWLELPLTSLVAVSLVYNFHHDTRTTKLIWRAGSRWSFDHNHRQASDATLHSVDFLSRWLVVIKLKPDNATPQRLVIPFDSVAKDSYRLFRVRLRIEGHSLLNPSQTTT